METYFDSRIDLLQRRLQKHSDRLKLNAEKAFKIPSGDVLSKEALSENFDREVKNFKLKVRQSQRDIQLVLITLLLGVGAYGKFNSIMAFCKSCAHP
jgi:hypothetical protein